MISSRQLMILQSIIDDYILTGVPVGSRTLSKRMEGSLSSATIRNEMADLEDEGYLEQPHTSAGRMPTEKAYRLYVDTLMRVNKLNAEELRTIRKYFSSQMDEIDNVVATAAKALSDLTHMTSVVIVPEPVSYTHLMVGTASLVSPDACLHVAEELESFCRQQEIGAVRELTGTLAV